MVATRLISGGVRIVCVSIPIGFSNGCNFTKAGRITRDRVSIPIGFSNGCNLEIDAGKATRIVRFQSLSGFLMVATSRAESGGLCADGVSIPIGFSNGCNPGKGHPGCRGAGFQSLSGFLMVATGPDVPALTGELFQSLSGFLMVATAPFFWANRPSTDPSGPNLGGLIMTLPRTRPI